MPICPYLLSISYAASVSTVHVFAHFMCIYSIYYIPYIHVSFCIYLFFFHRMQKYLLDFLYNDAYIHISRVRRRFRMVLRIKQRIKWDSTRQAHTIIVSFGIIATTCVCFKENLHICKYIEIGAIKRFDSYLVEWRGVV